MVWRAVELGVLSLVVIEGVAQAGEAVRRFISRGNPDSLERAGTDYLVGLSALGPALLGLAAGGLFRPVLLVATCLGLAAAGFVPGPRSILAGAVRSVVRPADGRRPGVGALAAGCAALVLGLATSLVWVLVPETEIDSYVSHLAAPDQFLKAGRILVDWVPLSFRISLPTEMVYALALILGDDRIAKCMSLAAFGAAAAVFASGCLRRGHGYSPWAGPLLAISSASLMWLAPMTKHDATAAAMIVSGFLLLRRRASPVGARCERSSPSADLVGARCERSSPSADLVGALLLGAGMTAKIVYGPFAVLFFLLVLPPGRLIPPCLAVMALPELPWMAKEFFASGNPVYPFGAGLVPTFGWDARNWAVFNLRQRTLVVAEMTGVPALVRTWWGWWRTENLLFMLCLPGVLMFARRRAWAWIVVAGELGMLWFTRQPRYLLPATWLLAFLAAEEGERLVQGRRGGGAIAVAAAAWMILATSVGALGDRWKLWGYALGDSDAVFAKVMSTYADMGKEIRQRGVSRILVVGEFRTYRLPGRVVYNGCLGETPIVWKEVGESRTTGELRKRIRQLGVRSLMYNCAGSKWVQIYSESYGWTRRMAALYSDFCRRYLELAVLPRQLDYANGGYYLYRVSDSGRLRPSDEVFFLPGAEGICYKGLELMGEGRYAEAITDLTGVVRDNPSVMAFRSTLAFCHYVTGNWATAYGLFSPPIAKGYADTVNVPSCAIVAYNVGRFDEAERLYRASLARYPDHADPARVGIGSVYAVRALRYMKEDRIDAAEAAIARAEEWLRLPTSYMNPTVETQRRQRLAQLTGFKGDIERARGRPAKAVERYREAFRIAPDVPGAENWLRVIEELSRGTGSR